MRELQGRFRANQEQVLTLLQKVKDSVEAGKAPSQEECAELTDSLTELSGLYDEIRCLSGLQTAGLSVEDYQRIWENSLTFRKPLEDFLLLRCPSNETVSQALAAEQDKVRALLNGSLDEKTVSLYSDFLRYVREGTDLNGALSVQNAGFSSTLAMALLAVNVFVFDKEESVPEAFPAEESIANEHILADEPQVLEPIPEPIPEPVPEPTPELKDSLSALNRDALDAKRPSANAVIKLLKKNPPLWTSVWFLISRLGMADIDGLSLVMNSCFANTESAAYDALQESLSGMSKEGLLAVYQAPRTGRTVYAPSEYGIQLQSDEAVRSWVKNNRSVLMVTYCTGLRAVTSRDELLRNLQLSDGVISYLSWVCTHASGDAPNQVLRGMRRSQKGRLRVPVLSELGQQTDCELYLTSEEDLPDACVLLAGNSLPAPVAPREKETFVIRTVKEPELLRLTPEGIWEPVSLCVEDAGDQSQPLEERAEYPSEQVAEPSAEEAEESASDGQERHPSPKKADAYSQWGLREEESDEDAIPKRFLTEMPAESPVEIAGALLDKVKGGDKPDDEEMLALIQSLLAHEPAPGMPGNRSKTIQALILSSACAEDPQSKRQFPSTAWLYRRLRSALHLPMDDEPYSINQLNRFPESDQEAVQALKLATAIHAVLFMSNRAADFYTVKGTLANLSEQFDSHFSNWKELKSLFHCLITARQTIEDGFNDKVLAALLDQAALEKEARRLAAEADLLRSSTPQTTIRLAGINAFMKQSLGPHSVMAHFLSYVCEDGQPTEENLEFTKEYLRTFCGDGVDQGIWEVDNSLLIQFVQDGVNANRTSKVEVQFTALNKICKEFKHRIRILADWLSLYGGSYAIDEIKPIFNETRRALEDAAAALRGRAPSAWRTVLITSLECALARLQKKSLKNCFVELLHTGYISLDSQWLPVMEPSLYDVNYSQPWYLMLEHIHADVRSLEDARNSILMETDNCIQLRQIEEILSLPPTQFEEPVLDGMKARADLMEKGIRDKLEEASVFGRMDDNERERMMDRMTALKPVLLAERNGCRDYGRWCHFLSALELNMSRDEERQRAKMEKLLANCQLQQRSGQEPEDLIREINRMVRQRNYAVAEEYISLFQQGHRRIPDSFQTYALSDEYFDVFMRPAIYNSLLEYCLNHSARGLYAFGSDWVSTSKLINPLTRELGRTWTQRDINSAKQLLDAWPKMRGMPSSGTITELFLQLGIAASDCKRCAPGAGNADVFSLKITPQPRNKESYDHPIKYFGTSPDTEATVVCLYGGRTAAALLSDVSRCISVNTTTFVLFDFALDLAVRRQLAEQVRLAQMGSHSPLLVIDRVLMLYLCTVNQTERLRALLSCTLPFAICQPFNGDRGLTADEMFAGRIRELNDIRSHNGACVVYGGRQLGKTALLRRAESLEHTPDLRRYAVYVDLLNHNDEEKAVRKIVEEVLAKVGDPEIAERLNDVSDMTQFCGRLRTLIEDGVMDRFLLLLDEMDIFLAAESTRGFKAIWPLYELWKNRSGGKFKFVMAGLHNVRRTLTETNNQFNSPFGQMGSPLSIKPLSTADAQLLLMRPLQYLGFRIDNDSVLRTILVSTCYYPGIIQFFGHQLVDAVNGNYSQYYRAQDGSPPFLLTHEQLGAVMNSGEMTDSIRDKINLTMELDIRYKLLACCIAWCYMMDDAYAASGCSAQDILDVARAEDISILLRLRESEILNLLDEMEIMGILVGDEDHQYRFRRSFFKTVVGTNEDDLERNIRAIKEKEG